MKTKILYKCLSVREKSVKCLIIITIKCFKSKVIRYNRHNYKTKETLRHNLFFWAHLLIDSKESLKRRVISVVLFTENALKSFVMTPQPLVLF